MRVLLVETGDRDGNPLIGFGELMGDPTTVWHYPTRPIGPSQQVEYWVRDKTLGGSTAALAWRASDFIFEGAGGAARVARRN